MGSSWQFQADVNFRTLYGNSGFSGLVSLALAQTNYLTTILADITRKPSSKVLIEVEYFGAFLNQ
jgi:hypothetical protein